jgi:hypothetical protein
VLYNELAAMLLHELQRQERTIQKQQGRSTNCKERKRE